MNVPGFIRRIAERLLSRAPVSSRLQVVLTLGHSHLGTQHLLLGLLGVRGGVAFIVLKEFNVGIEAVRENVIQLVASGARER